MIGWNPAVERLPVVAQADRIPGDWLVREYARLPGAARTSLWAALGFVCAAGLSMWLWARRRRRRARLDQLQGIKAGESLNASLQTEVDTLIRSVARLDVAFAEGALPEGGYRRRRKGLMRRLEHLVAASGDGADRLLAGSLQAFSGEPKP